MRQALRLAAKAGALGEVPIGAVIVDASGRVIAKSHNQVETLRDGTAHAEMLALSIAQAAIGDRRLEGCTLFVTKEPCVMCAGALVLCRPSRVVYACGDSRSGGAGGWINLLDSNPPLNHRCEVQSGLLQEESLALLQDFFRAARQQSGERKAARQAKLTEIDAASVG